MLLNHLVGLFNSITGKQKFLAQAIDGRNFIIDLKVAIGNVGDYRIHELPLFRDPGNLSILRYYKIAILLVV